MSMTKVELETFVEGTTHYFQTAANQPASVGSPYLVNEGAPGIQEYTGIITIGGKRRGIVYFTASRPMLTVLLMRLGETEMTHENMCDLVGEVANQISGNARRDFGSEFMISVPRVIAGTPEHAVTPANVRSFVIPINWRSHSAKLIVSLK
jgi:chemotaxis protein CheX